jgi:hypothetical protein
VLEKLRVARVGHIDVTSTAACRNDALDWRIGGTRCKFASWIDDS